MHDQRLLRERPELLREGLRRRGALPALEPMLESAAALERERRELIQAVEERKAARNAATQEVARRRKLREDAADFVERSRTLGDEIGKLEGALSRAERALDAILLELPNIPLPEVPAGGEEANVVVRAWGEPRPGDGLRPHWEIGSALGILDFERGAKLAGSGFIVLRGAGARLARGLMNFMIDLHTREHGYDETWVPYVANSASMTGTGQLPKFADDMYGVRDEDLWLIPTAEVPLTNLHRDEILDADRLPIGLVAYSPCFRREAGAHGKDTRGLIRVHEFDKVELVWYSTPEDSADRHEQLTRHAEAVLQRLELPHRVVLLAAGDTGFASAKTYDLEVWAPGLGKWLEVSSSSTCTDFQARRANIRYRPAPREKPRFVHTLNASGLAFPRTIIAVLEHYQNADGTVTVPEPLRTYLGTDLLR
ncbi:MAG TPA: serine--tRNA ligase [Gemmatimonadaceae bacterium]|nr:serine--tRNA ligase [Gemmatimonadaceae bacterium]